MSEALTRACLSIADRRLSRMSAGDPSVLLASSTSKSRGPVLVVIVSAHPIIVLPLDHQLSLPLSTQPGPIASHKRGHWSRTSADQVRSCASSPGQQIGVHRDTDIPTCRLRRRNQALPPKSPNNFSHRCRSVDARSVSMWPVASPYPACSPCTSVRRTAAASMSRQARPRTVLGVVRGAGRRDVDRDRRPASSRTGITKQRSVDRRARPCRDTGRASVWSSSSSSRSDLAPRRTGFAECRWTQLTLTRRECPIPTTRDGATQPIGTWPITPQDAVPHRELSADADSFVGSVGLTSAQLGAFDAATDAFRYDLGPTSSAVAITDRSRRAVQVRRSEGAIECHG